MVIKCATNRTLDVPVVIYCIVIAISQLSKFLKVIYRVHCFHATLNS